MPSKNNKEQSHSQGNKLAQSKILKTETFVQIPQNGESSIQGSSGSDLKKKRAQSSGPKFKKNSPYTGPAIPLNAFQCYLKALGNCTVKQAKIKWTDLEEHDKDKYLQMAKLDLQRFDVEIELMQLQLQKRNQLGKVSKVLQEETKLDQNPKSASKSPKFKESQKQPIQKVVNENQQIEFEKKTEVVDVQETQNIVRPKKPRNSFICFMKHIQPEEMKDGQIKVQKLRLKEYGEKWANMTAEEKQKFVDISKNDHDRYDQEMKEFNEKGTFQNTDGICSSTLSQISKKSPKSKKNKEKEIKSSRSPKRSKSKMSKAEKQNVVKNPKSAYLCYMNKVVAQIIKDQKLSGCQEASKIIGKQWTSMSEVSKQPYIQMAQADKLRFQKQKQELQQNGYFILQDGSKSTDLIKPPKLVGKKRESDMKPQQATNSLGDDDCSLESHAKKQK